MLFLICSEIIVLQLAKIEHFAQIYHPLGKKKLSPPASRLAKRLPKKGRGQVLSLCPGGQMAYRVIVQPSIMPL